MKKTNKLGKIILFLTVLTLFSSLSLADSSGQLKVTLEHPFYLNGEWVEAKELQVGDVLKTYDGKKVRITNIEDVEAEEPFLVYNLEDDFYLHNYIVDKGLVVHNSNQVLQRPVKNSLTRRDAFRARRFIDKDHYEMARSGKYPGGSEGAELVEKPWLAYERGYNNVGSNKGNWQRWKSADDFLYGQIKPRRGMIDGSMVQEVGRRLGVSNYRSTPVQMGGDYRQGFFNIFKRLTIQAAKKNPYLRVDERGVLKDNSHLLKLLLDRVGRNTPDGQYIMANSKKLIIADIYYPNANEVPLLMKGLISRYNAKLGCVRTQADWARFAAEFQQKYVSIHPFRDFNGRSSRLFMDYILQSGDLPPAHLANTMLDVFSSGEVWAGEVISGVETAAGNAYYLYPIK